MNLKVKQGDLDTKLDKYLRDIKRKLKNLDSSEVNSYITEIKVHLKEMIAQLQIEGEDPDEIMYLIMHYFGSPDDIATEFTMLNGKLCKYCRNKITIKQYLKYYKLCNICYKKRLRPRKISSFFLLGCFFLFLAWFYFWQDTLPSEGPKPTYIIAVINFFCLSILCFSFTLFWFLRTPTTPSWRIKLKKELKK